MHKLTWSVIQPPSRDERATYVEIVKTEYTDVYLDMHALRFIKHQHAGGLSLEWLTAPALVGLASGVDAGGWFLKVYTPAAERRRP